MFCTYAYITPWKLSFKLISLGGLFSRKYLITYDLGQTNSLQNEKCSFALYCYKFNQSTLSLIQPKELVKIIKILDIAEKSKAQVFNFRALLID